MKQTILAVGDEISIVQLCTVMLEQAGFSVLPASKNSEVLKICKDHPGPIDLLLTDLVMLRQSVPDVYVHEPRVSLQLSETLVSQIRLASLTS